MKKKAKNPGLNPNHPWRRYPKNKPQPAKYSVTFQRQFTVEVDADSLGRAEQVARHVLEQFPLDSGAKLLSITPLAS